jgi:hypothetical protein
MFPYAEPDDKGEEGREIAGGKAGCTTGVDPDILQTARTQTLKLNVGILYNTVEDVKEQPVKLVLRLCWQVRRSRVACQRTCHQRAPCAATR